MKYIRLVFLSCLILLTFVGCTNKGAVEYANYLKKDFTDDDIIMLYSIEKNKVMHCNEELYFGLKTSNVKINNYVGRQICSKIDGLGLFVKPFVSEKEDDFDSKDMCGNLAFSKMKKGQYFVRKLRLETSDANKHSLDILIFDNYKNKIFNFEKRGIYYLGNFTINKFTKSPNCRLAGIDLEVKDMEGRDLELFFKKYPKLKKEKVFNISKDIKEKKMEVLNYF